MDPDPEQLLVMSRPNQLPAAVLAIPLIGLFLPVLAVFEATAGAALALGRITLLAGLAALVASMLLDPSRPTVARSGSALLLAGVAAEGFSRLLARPLSFDPYPVALGSVLALAVLLLSLRRPTGFASLAVASIAAGSVIATTTGDALEAASLLAGAALALLPSIGIGVVIARALGLSRLGPARAVLVALTLVFGGISLLRMYAGLRISEDLTGTASNSLIAAAMAGLVAGLLLVLPAAALRTRSGVLAAALPVAFAVLGSAPLAMLPLERDQAEGLARATDAVEADMQLVQGMIAEVGAGPRDEFRGMGFYDCDRLNSRDCFITHYDDIALKKGVTAAVADLVDKVKNNKGATFPAHCHQVVHNLGQMAFQLADKFNQASDIDPQVCGTGYTHGLWEQQFEIIGTEAMFNRTGTLCKDLNMVSDWYKWTCHHILGHLMAAKLSADPGRAVEYCNNVKDPQGFTDCQTGGWMNFFQDDAVIAKMRASGSLKDLFGVCWGASESTKFFCYQELFPVIYSMIDGNDYAAGQACLDFSEPARGTGLPWTVAAQNYADRCIQGLARGIGASSAQNFMLMRDRCLSMPDAAHDPCLTAAAASYVLNTGGAKTAFQICEFVGDDAYREYCYFWTKHARKLLANGPNSHNLPDEDEVRLPEFLPGQPGQGVLIPSTTVPGSSDGPDR